MKWTDLEQNRGSLWPKLLLGISFFLVPPLCVILWNGYTGPKHWEAALSQLEEQGEPTDLQALYPEPLEAQRDYFCEHPIIRQHTRATLETSGDIEAYYATPIYRSLKHFSTAHIFTYHREPQLKDEAEPEVSIQREPDFLSLGRAMSLPVNEENAATLVLERLKQYDASLASLREIGWQPAGHLWSHLDGSGSSELQWMQPGIMHQVAKVCIWRARALLELGRGGEALMDLKIAMRLGTLHSTAPSSWMLISGRIIRQDVVSCIWQGLAEDRWRPEHLRELQDELNTWSNQADALRTLRYVALRMTEAPESLAQNLALGESPGYLDELLHQVPGVLDHNRANGLRIYHDYLIQPWAAEDWDQLTFDRVEAELRKNSRSPNWSLVPSPSYMVSSSLRFVELDAYAALARSAIALELWEMDKGSYPDSLEVLVPDYLDAVPEDPLDHQPLRYAPAQNPGEPYQLYSIGWNLEDEGGEVAVSTTRVNRRAGDWVWAYAGEEEAGDIGSKEEVAQSE